MGCGGGEEVLCLNTESLLGKHLLYEPGTPERFQREVREPEHATAGSYACSQVLDWDWHCWTNHAAVN